MGEEGDTTDGSTAAPVSTRRTRLWVACGAVAVVVLVVVGIVMVSTDDQERPAAPRSTQRSTTRSTPPAPPSLEPLPVAAKPLWTSRGPGEAVTAEVRDGVAIYDGQDLRLVDAASGAVRWSVVGDEDLLGGDGAQLLGLYVRPRLVGHGAGLAVLADYYWTNCPEESCFGNQWKDEAGLVLLSAADGRVRWRVPTFEPGEESFWLEYVDDRTALVSVAAGEHAAAADVRAMAIDVRTGKVRWERTGFWPRGVVGDTVLGDENDGHPDSRELDDMPDDTVEDPVAVPDGGVAGFDLATGAPRWERDDSELMLTGGDVALVRDARGRDVEAMIVEGATGREVTKFVGTAEFCAADEAMLACQVDLDGLDEVATFRFDDRKVEVSASGLTAFGVDAVWRDRIFVHNARTRYTITRAGNRVDRRLPGELVAITDDYALFRVSKGGTATIQCFALG
jgi:outer membrane protein assembly factor BamB